MKISPNCSSIFTYPIELNLYFFENKMTIHLNVLSLLIKYKIRCNMVSFVGMEVLIPTSIKCYKIHIISHIDCVFALYSDYALE